MPGAATRKDRLNFRLDRRHKALIERAASASGQSLTEFALSHLVRDAQSVIREQEITVLSDRDREVFLSVLEGARPANAALKQAAKIYRRQRAEA